MRGKLYHGGSREQVERLADEALDALITEHLLARAVERRGIAGAPDAVAARMAALRGRYEGSASWPEIAPRLGEIEARLLLDSRIAALRAAVMAVAPPDEAVLRAFHAENPKLFTEPAAYDIDLILLGVDPSASRAEWQAAGEKAAAIRAELIDGRPFRDAAAAHSTHSSAARGGDVGRVHQGQLPDAAQSALEALRTGSLSDPVRILEGYLLMRLNRRHPARLRPFEDVRDRAAGLWQRRAATAQWARFLGEQRAAVPVETYPIDMVVRRFLPGE